MTKIIPGLRDHMGNLAPEGSCLRKLAFEIATMTLGDAQKSLIYDCKGTPAGKVFHPVNLLANGAAQNWKTPTPNSPTGSFSARDIQGLETWKAGGNSINSCNGFTGIGSGRGLSLLFDPLVDYFILNNFHKRSPSTVILLTDYYPFLCSEWPGSNSNDWGEYETWRYTQKTMRSDPTSRTLDHADLFDCRSKVFLWNFFPLFRGGTTASGGIGLPTGSKWRGICLKWFIDFCNCINAQTVIVSANGEYVGYPLTNSSVSNVSSGPISNPSNMWPKHIDVYRTYHPSAPNPKCREQFQGLIKRIVQ